MVFYTWQISVQNNLYFDKSNFWHVLMQRGLELSLRIGWPRDEKKVRCTATTTELTFQRMSSEPVGQAKQYAPMETIVFVQLLTSRTRTNTIFFALETWRMLLSTSFFPVTVVVNTYFKILNLQLLQELESDKSSLKEKSVNSFLNILLVCCNCDVWTSNHFATIIFFLC